MLKVFGLTTLLFCFHDHAYAGNITVTGRVYSVDGVPQGGVNILLKGTSVATATDMSGAFSLTALEGKAVLIFAFVRRKTVEHEIILQKGFQYQVNVQLSHKTQTFNKSIATTSMLPADAAVILGRITDEKNSVLSGVLISQSNKGFKTISDADGNFALPVAGGKVVITFRRNGSKDLDLEVDLNRGISHSVEVILVNDNVPRAASHASRMHP